ncbi:MAG: chemotaxis protein CheD [Peptococcaceae bacterium]|nr:chemotaxis protein CheD [Peptococcaceae bacterium]
MQLKRAQGMMARQSVYSTTGFAEIQVGIAELKVARQPDRLITYSLGSCVGVSLYDPLMKVGGLLHIMLPDSTQFNDVNKPAKFADLGIPLLLREVRRRGARKANLQAKMVGGAQMFSGANKRFDLDIGKRNGLMARQVLRKMGIGIYAEELGGNRGRTMILDTFSGQVFIRMAGSPVKVI